MPFQKLSLEIHRPHCEQSALKLPSTAETIPMKIGAMSDGATDSSKTNCC